MTMSNPTAPSTQPRKIRNVLISYWIIVLAAGLLIPEGDHARALGEFVTKGADLVPAIREISVHAFDKHYFRLLAIICLGSSVILSATILVIIIRTQGTLVFHKLREKLTTILICACLFIPASLIPSIAIPGPYSLGGGRTSALLHIATSSRIGAVAVVGGFFGFAQLVFAATTLVAVLAPIQSGATQKRQEEENDGN